MEYTIDELSQAKRQIDSTLHKLAETIEHGQARHDQSETREGTTGRLTHPQGPREPLRKVRAGQRSGRRAAPLPSTDRKSVV